MEQKVSDDVFENGPKAETARSLPAKLDFSFSFSLPFHPTQLRRPMLAAACPVAVFGLLKLDNVP